MWTGGGRWGPHWPLPGACGKCRALEALPGLMPQKLRWDRVLRRARGM